MNERASSAEVGVVRGKRVTVMGLGRFGGGVGVTRWLCERGADVLVTDVDSEDKLTDSLASIRGLVDSGRVRLRLGGHNVADFTREGGCDLVVANVAVPKPWENRFLRAAEAAGVPINTEITLTVEELRRVGGRGVERIVGITGSAGKSTTTAMVHHALRTVLGRETRDGAHRVVMGGNIGGSLLGEMDRIGPDTVVVLELSSAMVYWLERTLSPAWSPRVAVITNVSPNHIDWHGDFAHYAASKRHLIEHQREGNAAVLGEVVWDWRSGMRAGAVMIDPETFTLPLKLPGEHNRTNAAGALAACRAIAPEVEAAEFARAIAGFTGLAHRLQLVCERPVGCGGKGGVIRFYNDSKSTTPESALRAVEAVASMPGVSMANVHLIAGGYDKGSDLSPIARLGERLAGLYTIGATGPSIAGAAGGAAIECGSLGRAVSTALGRMRAGDVLLLSPGCASWDQYVNFEKRGEEFVRLVGAAGPTPKGDIGVTPVGSVIQ
ncbi:MAG TPA: Mur ligase family protein [Phycisphaerales bacterium]|nr:Mur ligase family protein [Phycisphaerales bacterium]